MTAQDTDEVAGAPRDYPEHWEADVLLRDGRTAHLRPILPEDAEGLVEFYAQVSEQSKYFRFFAPMPTLSDRDVQRFTNVDYHERVAFVMTVAEKIIAVGRYDVIEKGQRRGRLPRPGPPPGPRHRASCCSSTSPRPGANEGSTGSWPRCCPDNRRMIQVFREQGYQVKGGWDEGVMHLEFDIDPTDTAIGVIAAREHRSEAASIATFLNATQRRGHRRLPAQRHHRRRCWCATWCSATTRAGSTS